MTRKQFKCQQLAEHLWSIALLLASETARQQSVYQSTYTEQHGVISEEARRLYNFVTNALDKNIFNELSDEDFDKLIIEASNRTAFLALNSAILCSKKHILKQLAVYAEEMRNISLQLQSLCGVETLFPIDDFSSVEPRNSVSNQIIGLFTGVSGKYTWSENTQFVVELMMYCPEYIKNNRLQIVNEWRNMDIPVISLDDNEGNIDEKNLCLVIVCDPFEMDKEYAVVIMNSGVNAISNSYVGVATESKIDIPTRECWQTSDGKNINFIDWAKLVKE